jgi:hypothetical protein
MNLLRDGNLLRRTIATSTLFAMLVAPLCASICRSRACANLSSSQSEDCHSSLAADNNGPQTRLAAVRGCGLQELPSATLNEKSHSPERMQQASAVCTSPNFVAAQSVRVQVSGACYSRFDHERGVTNTSAQPAVLRI